MIGIFRFADNPFDSVLISNARLAAFAEDAATRLLSTHPVLSQSIAQAQQAFSRITGKVAVEDEEKETGTDGVDVFLADLARYMEATEAQLIVSLGKDSAAYAALYPNKKQTYTRLRKSDAPARLDAVKRVAEDNSRRLPAEVKDRLVSFRAAWDDARAAQNAAEGRLSGSRAERDAARAELEDRLFVALLDLSKEFRQEPQRLRSYFDHTLLDAPRHASLERRPEAPAL